MPKEDDSYSRLMPIRVSVEEGQEYRWCSCGKSQHPPWCDKTDCGVLGVRFVAELTEDVVLCNCKTTKNPPYCDGSHSALLLAEINKRRKKGIV